MGVGKLTDKEQHQQLTWVFSSIAARRTTEKLCLDTDNQSLCLTVQAHVKENSSALEKWGEKSVLHLCN